MSKNVDAFFSSLISDEVRQIDKPDGNPRVVSTMRFGRSKNVDASG